MRVNDSTPAPPSTSMVLCALDSLASHSIVGEEPSPEPTTSSMVAMFTSTGCLTFGEFASTAVEGPSLGPVACISKFCSKAASSPTWLIGGAGDADGSAIDWSSITRATTDAGLIVVSELEWRFMRDARRREMAGIFTHPGENGHGDSAETEPEVGDPEVVPARSGVRLSASEDTERTLSKRTAADSQPMSSKPPSAFCGAAAGTLPARMPRAAPSTALGAHIGAP